MNKKLLSVFLCVVMVLGLMPAAAWGAEAGVSLDLANGSVVITATGYTQGDAETETAYVGAYTITQTDAATATPNTITVGGEQNITLNGVNILASGAAITITGTAAVTLVGDNTVTSADNFAGVQVETGAELTITEESTGSLTATGGHYAAGIGGGMGQGGGTIIINGGTVTAYAGAKDTNTSYSGAGIGGGGGDSASCPGGTITINGGVVNAYGARTGAGIGGGGGGKGKNDGGTITITGGTVTTDAGFRGGAGIGGGYNSTGGVITITGGIVKANGAQYGAGIGGSNAGGSGIITISGGYVEAKGFQGAGIGNGQSSRAPAETDEITISGKDTVVKAWGGGGSAGIGGAWNSNNPVILIDAATVYAYGGERGTGIGAGQFEYANPITIQNGADVTAIGGIPGDDSYYGAYGGGAGIGSGSGFDEATHYGTITITDSTVYAQGGSGHKDSTAGGGAGIGSAGGGASATNSEGHTTLGGGGTINITNSHITAIGGNGGMKDGGGAGIGGGSNGGVSGNITITGGTIYAVGGNGFDGGTGTGAGAGIGGGSKGGIGNVTYTYDGNGSVATSTSGSATISISDADLTAIGGKGVGEMADGEGFGVGSEGEDVEGSTVNITCGTYSTDPTDYVPAESSIIKHTSSNTVLFYVGSSSAAAGMQNAEAGDSVEVMTGDAELEIPVADVTVTNPTGGTVTVNGDTVTADAEYVTTEQDNDQDNDQDNGEASSLWNDWALLVALYSQEFTIDVTATEGGSVTSNKDSRVLFGKSITYTITPDEGYEIVSVFADGKDVGALDSYTFKNVRKNHTLSAVFAKTPVQNPFADITADDWFYEDVLFVNEKGLMLGVSTSEYAPDAVLNRATIVMALWRMAGSPDAAPDTDFTDLPEDWYTPAMKWAIAEGILLGYGDNTCRPLAEITHEQAAAIFHRYMAARGTAEETADASPALLHSDWAANDVLWAAANGLFEGFGSDISDLTGNATRGEMAVYLHRLCALAAN